MTAELGLNLAGVERVLRLEAEIESMQARIEEIELEALQAQVRLAEELEEVRRSFRAELAVPYRGGLELVRAARRPLPVRRPAEEALDRCRPIASRSSPRRRSRRPAGWREERRNPQVTPLHLLAVLLDARAGAAAGASADSARRRGAAGAREARHPASTVCAPTCEQALSELPVAGEGSSADALAQPGAELLAVLRAAEREARQALRPVRLDRAPAARARRRDEPAVPRRGDPAPAPAPPASGCWRRSPRCAARTA